MPKAIPDKAMLAMLRERDVALWSADHYKDHRSTGKNPSKRDPVVVVLKIPEQPDKDFYGHGDTIDLAVATAFARNPALTEREGGLHAALARLSAALYDLTVPLCDARIRRATAAYREANPHITEHWDDLDDDVPF